MSKIRIRKLEDFVKNTEFSSKPLRLNVCSVIEDRRGFAESHLAILKANSGKKLVMPYYERLVLFYELIKAGK